MPKNKWKRQQKAYYDKEQTRLSPRSERGCTEPMTMLTLPTADPEAQYFCVFCLHIDKYNAFLISTGRGIHKGLAQCPECKQQMRMSSLLAEWTPEQYAEFAYPYAASGFWQKVPFKKWSERLKALGWSYRFWGRYKQLKGSDEEESYEGHLQRTQEEYAREMADEHE